METMRLLAVLAHPDDETFGLGGTLALYARRGVEVYLICATRGEVGDVDGDFMKGFQSVADRRESELRCAAGVLGLSGVQFLDYRDSGMPGSVDNLHPRALAAQPVESVALEIARSIRKLKPQVLVTFDPIGGYRHPDHIAIHNATVRAFDLAADQEKNIENLPAFRPQKFYFQSIPRGFLRWMVRWMKLTGRDPRKMGKNHDIDLQSIAEVQFPVDAVINYRSVASIRDQAAACHASQGGSSLTPGLIGLIRRELYSREIYMRAYPPPVRGHIEVDLFEGIR